MRGQVQPCDLERVICRLQPRPSCGSQPSPKEDCSPCGASRGAEGTDRPCLSSAHFCFMQWRRARPSRAHLSLPAAAVRGGRYRPRHSWEAGCHLGMAGVQVMPEPQAPFTDRVLDHLVSQGLERVKQDTSAESAGRKLGMRTVRQIPGCETHLLSAGVRFPQVPMLKSLSPVPLNVTLFGNSIVDRR